ncbi:MAG: helix-turn-helix domain-containing protein [Planctomycetota bacterium]
MPERSERFLSFEEALRELKLDIEELQGLVSDGRLRAFRDGESVRFREQDVLAFRKTKDVQPGVDLPPDPLQQALPEHDLLGFEGDQTRALSIPSDGGGEIGDVGSATHVPTIEFTPVGPGAGSGATEDVIFQDEEEFQAIPPVMEGDFVLDETALEGESDRTEAASLDETAEVRDVLSDTEKITREDTVFQETQEEIGIATDPLEVAELEDRSVGTGMGATAPVQRRRRGIAAGIQSVASRATARYKLGPEQKDRLRAAQQQRRGNPLFTTVLIGATLVSGYVAFTAVCRAMDNDYTAPVAVVHNWLREKVWRGGRDVLNPMDWDQMLDARNPTSFLEVRNPATGEFEKQPGRAEEIEERALEHWGKIQAAFREYWKTFEFADKYELRPSELPVDTYPYERPLQETDLMRRHWDGPYIPVLGGPTVQDTGAGGATTPPPTPGPGPRGPGGPAPGGPGPGGPAPRGPGGPGGPR